MKSHVEATHNGWTRSTFDEHCAVVPFMVEVYSETSEVTRHEVMVFVAGKVVSDVGVTRKRVRL